MFLKTVKLYKKNAKCKEKILKNFQIKKIFLEKEIFFN